MLQHSDFNRSEMEEALDLINEAVLRLRWRVREGVDLLEGRADLAVVRLESLPRNGRFSIRAQLLQSLWKKWAVLLRMCS